MKFNFMDLVLLQKRILLLLFSCPVVSYSLWPQGLQHAMWGLPVPHHLPKFAQLHVHCISDAIQPSHPLTPFSPSALNLSHIRDFSKELGICIRWPEYLSFSFSVSPSSEYPGLISLKIDGLLYQSWLSHHVVFSNPYYKDTEGINAVI